MRVLIYLAILFEHSLIKPFDAPAGILSSLLCILFQRDYRNRANAVISMSLLCRISNWINFKNNRYLLTTAAVTAETKYNDIRANSHKSQIDDIDFNPERFDGHVFNYMHILLKIIAFLCWFACVATGFQIEIQYIFNMSCGCGLKTFFI